MRCTHEWRWLHSGRPCTAAQLSHAAGKACMDRWWDALMRAILSRAAAPKGTCTWARQIPDNAVAPCAVRVRQQQRPLHFY